MSIKLLEYVLFVALMRLQFVHFLPHHDMSSRFGSASWQCYVTFVYFWGFPVFFRFWDGGHDNSI